MAAAFSLRLIAWKIAKEPWDLPVQAKPAKMLNLAPQTHRSNMTTLFVNRLTAIDFSYLDPAAGLLGESWLVDIELDGSLDHQGMVLDFSEVKKQVKRCIDQEFDHRLLVPARYAHCRVQQQEHRCDIRFQLTSGETLVHSGPNSAVTLIQAENITEESLIQAIIDRLQPLLPDNIQGLRLRLYAESITGAWYRYSHGLKHHAGNCQRIAHGHRSRIIIYRNGVRDQQLEANWANRWRDIYIGTSSDLQDSVQQDNQLFYHFGYTANQGLFKLEIPSHRCYLVDSDTTVENLAQHIADTLKREHPDDAFRVEAFEGVDKGAVGHS
ncbi:6-pyruvoyl trahydropterin synthase family protein [Sedimenticola selenatireducens]|uniref:6-pyruvoyl trahydropterin synthase family protein n=1 Tax=Sedimenticola selenatireducens TaxID=191960 RepID=UPI0004B9E96C|nr:6-carboxytetrahydropterin synthase [Sedimenticola selenatireducens]